MKAEATPCIQSCNVKWVVVHDIDAVKLTSEVLSKLLFNPLSLLKYGTALLLRALRLSRSATYIEGGEGERAGGECGRERGSRSNKMYIHA